jgi:hypothetical protein
MARKIAARFPTSNFLHATIMRLTRNQSTRNIPLPATPTRLNWKIILFCTAIIVILVTYSGFLFWLTKLEDVQLPLKGQMGDSFGMLSSLFTAMGFVGVATTLWMQRDQNKTQAEEHIIEVEERRSLFNLNASIDATERARLLLENHNNHRRTWIEAGRLLGHAKSFGDDVTLESHRKLLEINRLKYRNFFSSLIEEKPASFFYGIYLDDEGSLNDYMRASSAGEQLPNGRTLVGNTRELPEVSLYRVWEASQWPEKFDDPLGQKFTDKERQRLAFDSEGMLEYLNHRDAYHASIRQNSP